MQAVIAVLVGVVLISQSENGWHEAAMGRGWNRLPPRRRWRAGASGRRASASEPQTLVPISTWHSRNSGLNWPCSCSPQRAITSGGAGASAKLSRSTSRYSLRCRW
ncbi:MAG: hypothetical protein R3D85_04125 [Paracoccaceae bacterium]